MKRTFPMYFRIDNEIIDKYGEQLGAYGLAVYMCLARFTNQEGISWPSYETIAKRIGISRRKVITEVQKLVELNLIEVSPQVYAPSSTPLTYLVELKYGFYLR